MSELFLRISDPKLSLWQSVVAEQVKNKHFADTETTHSKMDVLQHEMVKATNVFVDNRFNKRSEQLSNAAMIDDADPADIKAHLSELAYEIAWAKIENREDDVRPLMEAARKFADDDWMFLFNCIGAYTDYYIGYGGKFKYNDWKVEGKNDINYGVIDYKIPNNAKVGIIGDWGTGMKDAYALLVDMISNRGVDVIIHLGDIYYSGTPLECEENFAKIIRTAFRDVGRIIPVFTIPGNHDYYALGWGYYEMVRRMNQIISSAVQHTSYFCLRTEDEGWQFLGMDTGLYDSAPGNQFNIGYAGPWLVDSELLWHIHKLDTFDGATVLLSHHQLFSANSAINGSGSELSMSRAVNQCLFESFRAFFSSKIAAWLWGHEHNFVLYQNDLYLLAKGRLIGASAYEELTLSDPYKVKFPDISYLDPVKYRLGMAAGYYNHNYAVIDLSVRKKPTDPVEISYYEFPSWGQFAPAEVKSSLIYSEKLVKPAAAKRDVVYNRSSSATLRMNGGIYFIGPAMIDAEYYVQLSASEPVPLVLFNAVSTGMPLKDGDIILIATPEQKLGEYRYLGAWTTPSTMLYYYKLLAGARSTNQQWRIRKQNVSNDNIIYYGDAVSFENIANAQWIAQWPSALFLTTSGDESRKAYFILGEGRGWAEK